MNPNAFAPSAISLAVVINVPATTLTKDAITRIKTIRVKMMKSFFAIFPMDWLMISPTVFPSLRIDAKRDPKS